MKKTTDTRLIAATDILVAGALMTRLPLPHAPMEAFSRQAQAAWAYPIVGAVLAVLAALVWQLLTLFGLPNEIVAALVIASLSLMTGALHEDGLADMFDGLWGGHEPARRLEIMKDSAIGSYGVLALITAFAVEWSALSHYTIPAALMVAVCMSRAVLPMVMRLVPQARKAGLAAKVGAPSMATAGIALALGLGCSALVLGLSLALVSMAVAGLVAALLAIVAKRKIGGITGDILGATQQISEIAILLALLPLLGS